MVGKQISALPHLALIFLRFAQQFIQFTSYKRVFWSEVTALTYNTTLWLIRLPVRGSISRSKALRARSDISKSNSRKYKHKSNGALSQCSYLIGYATRCLFRKRQSRISSLTVSRCKKNEIEKKNGPVLLSRFRRQADLY